jgi:hypothetical protein
MQFQILTESGHHNYNDKQVAVWNLKPINQATIEKDDVDQTLFYIENLLVNGSNVMPRLKSQAKTITGNTRVITTIREARGYGNANQV